MINKELLQQMVAKRFVNVQKHPVEDLYIYNYSPVVQYGKVWNEVTLKTRGLILDGEGNVVARPFGKFFNYEEHLEGDIPEGSFEVYEKMDGSLGILYWMESGPAIATRGSFTSEQAYHATGTLLMKYGHLVGKLERGVTYLFEIIYPENRIVVDYGGMDDLVLLAVIDNITGRDLELPDIGFPVVKRYDGVRDIKKLRELSEDNKEGFVVKFEGGFRVKLKFEEYCRLHRIVTNVSNVVIWEYLSEGKRMDDLLDRVPDEFYGWVRGVSAGLKSDFKKIEDKCKGAYKEFPIRKESAEYFKGQEYPSVLFKMLDGGDYAPIIWKLIKPKYSKPFKKEI